MRCPADILEPVLVIGGFVGGALGRGAVEIEMTTRVLFMGCF